MNTSGYSGTPLSQKLGLKPGIILYVVNPPERYQDLLLPWPEGAGYEVGLVEQARLVQAFYTERTMLEAEFSRLKNALAEDGILWISWPKGSSGMATDLSETSVREIGLAGGLVDVKVAAIDATWSGLKFVYRVQDRKSRH